MAVLDAIKKATELAQNIKKRWVLAPTLQGFIGRDKITSQYVQTETDLGTRDVQLWS